MKLDNEREVADLASANFATDPYPMYERLQAAGSVVWSPKVKAWVITRHDDVLAALKNANLSVDSFSAEKRRRPESAESAVLNSISDWLSFVDPPRHTRLRSVIGNAFTPRVITSFEPQIKQVVTELLDELFDAKAVDLVSRYAYPLPAIVISEMLGVPREDHDRFRQWSGDLMVFIGRAVGAKDRHQRAAASLSEMNDYLLGIVRQRREHPTEDLISRLVLAEAMGERLTDNEVVGTCAAILLGGHFTTQHPISSAVLALLLDPALQARIADEVWVAAAIEETLRWNSPVQSTLRLATTDLTISGTSIKKGEHVYLVLAAGNRDPEQFEAPDVFAPDRKRDHHLAFGHGIHFCIGAPLARVEARIAITELFRRYPRIALIEGDQRLWTEMIAFRGLTRLPIQLDGPR
jgi:cytochrome P450